MRKKFRETSNGVGIIRARPCRTATGSVIGADDTHDCAVGSRNEQERTTDEDKDVDADQEAPLEVADFVVPVVVQPHAGHGVETHQRSE